MTYEKITLYSLLAGAAVAFFWSIWLLVAELFGLGGFSSIPVVPDVLLLIDRDDVVLWSIFLPKWMEGLSRLAIDPLAAAMFAAVYLTLSKILLKMSSNHFKGNGGIVFGISIGFLIGVIIVSGGGDFSVISGVAIGVAFGIIVGIIAGVIPSINFVFAYALMTGFAFGMPVGFVALSVMAVPYLLLGICYLFYRGAREVIYAAKHIDDKKKAAS